MNKKDIRMQEPLYNMAFYTLIIGMILGLSHAVKILDTELQNRIILGLETFNFIPFIIAVICLISSIILCIIYMKKIQKHNLQNPTKKMKAFTAFTLNEFNDDDEFFSKVTNNATRKCYLFLVNSIGILILLLFLHLPYLVYIVMLFCFLIIQNLIYYTSMKKYYQ